MPLLAHFWCITGAAPAVAAAAVLVISSFQSYHSPYNTPRLVSYEGGKRLSDIYVYLIDRVRFLMRFVSWTKTRPTSKLTVGMFFHAFLLPVALVSFGGGHWEDSIIVIWVTTHHSPNCASPESLIWLLKKACRCQCWFQTNTKLVSLFIALETTFMSITCPSISLNNDVTCGTRID